MKRLTRLFGATLIASCIFSACNNAGTATQSANGAVSSQDAGQQLRAANDRFYAALNSMFMGNLGPMDSIWSHGDDVTDMGPFGGCLTSWDSVDAEFKKEAGMKLGGKVVCQNLFVHVGNDMGYTICTEAGENMSADGNPVMVSHRATNVFRLENGQWKLVHHHTDISLQLQQATGEETK